MSGVQKLMSGKVALVNEVASHASAVIFAV